MEIFKLFGSIFVRNEEANSKIDETDKKAKNTSLTLGNMVGTAAKWGAGIAAGATAAAGAIGALAVPLVKSAAEAKALNSQFEQTFGDLSESARDTLDQLGSDFGMLPNRLVPSFTKVTSMMKGFGMSTEDAMDAAGTAVTLAADAAAFYDVSLDNAEQALTSFLKGNTGAAESIGIFATAAGMADFAAEKLGLTWKDLDEGQKQLVRLEYVEHMQAAAGATGQAARESDGLENVMGNLRQAWEDLKVKFGEPILEPAIAGVMKLVEWLSNIDTETLVAKVEAAVSFIEESIKWLADNVLPIAVAAFDLLRDAIKFVIDNMDTLLPIVIGLTAAIAAQAVINTITNLMKAWSTATKTQTALQWLLNTALNANPLGLVALAIGAVIAVGVLLWKNWDTVKEKAGQFWTYLKDVMRGPVNFILGAINTVIGAYEKMINGLGTAINKIPKIKIPDWVPGLGGKEFGIPDVPNITLPKIPLLETGGDITEGGRVIVGEKAPEILDLPKGARVTPLDHPSVKDNPVIHTTINIDGRKVAESTSRPDNDRLDLRYWGRGVPAT